MQQLNDTKTEAKRKAMMLRGAIVVIGVASIAAVLFPWHPIESAALIAVVPPPPGWPMLLMGIVYLAIGLVGATSRSRWEILGGASIVGSTTVGLRLVDFLVMPLMMEEAPINTGLMLAMVVVLVSLVVVWIGRRRLSDGDQDHLRGA